MKDFDLAHSMFKYCPDTGLLTRTKTVSSRAMRGMVIQAKNTDGYIVVRFAGKLQYAHRLIWLMQTGEWPTHTIDHINSNVWDNRWINLRDVTYSDNLFNKAAPAGGVYYAVRDSRWVAECRYQGVRRILGSSKDRDVAESYYREWKKTQLPETSVAWNVK